MKERLKAILNERTANYETFKQEAYKYFEEFIPLLESALSEVKKAEKVCEKPKKDVKIKVVVKPKKKR